MNTKQRFSSMHTHTTFCDGKDDVETMCRAAYEKELFAVGFSAHAPIEKQTGKESSWNLKDERVDEYVSAVLAARERWRGKLNVFLGYEVDYIKGRRSPLDHDVISLNLDYIIGSVHYLFPENGADFFTVDGSKDEFEAGLRDGYNGDAEKLMNSYYDAQAEMISLGGFDILGHADLLKKNTQNKNLWSFEKEIKRQREIAYLAKEAGLVIEVNTGGINRNKTNDVYPSLEFLKIIREYNIPVIITADAHKAIHINGSYDIALNTLIMADIKEHFIFTGKKMKNTTWDREVIK